MSSRPYFQYSTSDLRELVQKHPTEREKLLDVVAELEHRNRPSARQLIADVRRLLKALDRGDVPARPVADAAPRSEAASPHGPVGIQSLAEMPLPLSDAEMMPPLPDEDLPVVEGEAQPIMIEPMTPVASPNHVPLDTGLPSETRSDPQRLRIKQIFRYLQALDQHRTPVRRQIKESDWLVWGRDIPVHETVSLGSALSSVLGAPPQDDESECEYVLRVRRPTRTRPPVPPSAIEPWIIGSWANPSGKIAVREQVKYPNPEGGEDRVERFEDSPRRIADWKEWLPRWESWAAAELPARAAEQLFDRFFDAHNRFEREGEKYDLVLGDGLLNWRLASGGISHPILLQSLQLEFNPEVPEFTLIESDRQAYFHSSIFRGLQEVSPQLVGKYRASVETRGISPLGKDETVSFLRGFVGELHRRGRYLESERSGPEGDSPTIARDPVFFLRPRAQGFAAFIEQALQHIEARDSMPTSLLGVAGFHSSIPEAQGEQRERPWEEPADLLLSKPANPEQIRIARALERSDGVLVQGPPGTGKTHTIANLVGHLLAEGKSVLVTSHTTKALRVVRGKVVPDLQPLCVSVLDSDGASRRELDQSIRDIADRLDSSDRHQLLAEAGKLTGKRERLLNELRKVRMDLIEARSGEYREIVVGGESYTPSDAAKRVSQWRRESSWVPQDTARGAPLPLSLDEVAALYRSNTAVSEEDELELDVGVPDPQALLPVSEFQRMVSYEKNLQQQSTARFDMLWGESARADDADLMANIAVRLQKTAEIISDAGDWQTAVLAAGMRGGPDAKLWVDFLNDAEEFTAKIATAAARVFRHGPEFTEDRDGTDRAKVLDEILDHLRSGGSLGRFALLLHPSWKLAIQAARVDGRVPCSTEDFDALRALLELQELRRSLSGRWRRLMGEYGLSEAVDIGEPERVVLEYVPLIRQRLEWHPREWKPIRQDLDSAGFDWAAMQAGRNPAHAKYADLFGLRDSILDVVHPAVEARATACRIAQAAREFARLLEVLSRYEKTPSLEHARAAVRTRDATQYAAAYSRFVDLAGRRPTLDERRMSLAKLAKAAPGWARAIRFRDGIHGEGNPPGDVAAAWLWRQLNNELEIRGKVDLSVLQERIDSLRDELRRATAKLIDRKAWAYQIERSQGSARQALMGYRTMLRRIGAGTGKRAAMLKSEVQRLMSQCRSAVPVWIMPLSRVAETFDPGTTEFDVVIIDEASQCDVMGLLAFYLGKNVVVVGDDEQVSPSAVGQKLDVVQGLIAENLQGIPNAMLYDGQTSVYDLANQSFNTGIMLREHFRCVPEIISFSNHLSYSGKIKPLRDASTVKLRPHTIAHRVLGGVYTDRKENHREAMEVAALVAAMTETPEYGGKSIGVISLVGDEQAILIDKILRDRIPVGHFEKHRILCGNSAQFQGDERAVMLLSMVNSPAGSGPLPIRGEGDQRFKQRFNVAASRAQDQLWVVHSLDPTADLQPGDLRLRLIQHALDPHALEAEIDRVTLRAESPFEKAVIQRLIVAGYRVTPQVKVGRFRLDMVVGGQDSRVVLECDGDRFHPVEKLAEDMERQATLERTGWRFIRIRGTQFYRHPDEVMEYVFRRLGELGVDASVQQVEADSSLDELRQLVVRRSAEILREWRGESPEEADENLIEALVE